ncbi:MAG: ATP-dependent helicase HrpB, partial [Deltaproteobacteria bacterium]|nr:ATP-dependent helicase HrpB [Deltaproteobacteria bacterium]
SGELAALAYPDRIAQKRSGSDLRFLLSSGQEVSFIEPEALSQCQYLVVVGLGGNRKNSRIRLAAAYSEESLRKQFGPFLKREQEVFWDQKNAVVVARERLLYGCLVLEERVLQEIPGPALASAWLDGVRGLGLELLPWNKPLRQWCCRVEFVRKLKLPDPKAWPACDEKSLLDDLETWLAPHLGAIRSREALARLDLGAILRERLSWEQTRQLEQLAPAEIKLASGIRARIDYQVATAPVLAAKVQELFGCRETPRIGGGRVPVLVHILSPARRPVQVTDDLAGFWQGSYKEVRKALRGRYPKHAWPEDPGLV